jgi:porin
MECFDGDELSGTGGFYVVAEQMLWRGVVTPPKGGKARAEETPQPNVAVFWQYGTANAEVSPFTRHVGGGMVWRGPWARRRGDVFGFGATWVTLNNEPEDGFKRSSELTLEAFYKIRIARFLSIVPDVQYIHSPGGLSSQRDCLVATPRLTISF